MGGGPWRPGAEAGGGEAEGGDMQFYAGGDMQVVQIQAGRRRSLVGDAVHFAIAARTDCLHLSDGPLIMPNLKFGAVS